MLFRTLHRAAIQTRGGSIKSLFQTPCARLTACATLSRPAVQDSNGQDEGLGKGNEEHDHNKKKSSTWKAARTAAEFLVCAAAGWYLNEYLNYSYARPATAPVTAFVKYTLIGKEDVSSTCAILKLRPSTSTVLDIHNPQLERSLLSVEFKQPQLQVARAYTLLPPQNDQDIDELRFLVRREDKGEVSNFLHRLPIGSEVELRGVAVEYELPERVGNVMFLAGGTGIAPAMQVADILEGTAYMHILWANRREEDCTGGQSDTAPATPGLWARVTQALGGNASGQVENTRRSQDARNSIVEQLQSLKRLFILEAEQTSNLRVDYFVDQSQTFITPDAVKTALHKAWRPETSANLARNILFVSGPPGFVEYWAGRKQWVEGREVQGPLGGILSTLEVTDWEIVKL